MIKDAILALKEKSGSHTIVKYVEEHHKADLPNNFKKILGHQLKNCVAKGKLIKSMASFKLFMLPKRRKLLKHVEKKYGSPKAAEKKPKAANKKPKVDASKKKATTAKPMNKVVVKKAMKSTPLKHKAPTSIKEG